MPGELRFIDELNTVLTEIEAASDRVIEAHDFGARRYRSRKIEGVIRRRVMADLGLSARIVALVPPRWIVKSTAGKLARSATRRRFLEAHPELGGAA
jgi:hypothetical protein